MTKRIRKPKLIQDETYPHLYRVKWPNGRLSVPVNLTRAKDAIAAYLEEQRLKIKKEAV